MSWKVLVLLSLPVASGLVANPAKLHQERDESQLLEEGMEFGHGGHTVKFRRLEHKNEDGSFAPFNAIVIGANRGIGFETSKQLAKMGAKVYLGCRDLKKCQEASELINAEKPMGSTIAEKAINMNSMASVVEYTDDIEKTLPHIDLIVVSAGVNFYTRGSNFTKEGFETSMQVNYLGPFVLAERLMPRLRNTASSQNPGGRVVFLSSDVHNPSKPVTPEDVDPKEDPADGMNYALTKFLLIQLAQEITRRERSTHGVSALAVHPGTVDTDLMASLLHGDPVSSWIYKTTTCGAIWLSGLYPNTPCPMTAEQGADTVVYAATDVALVKRHDMGTAYMVPGKDEPTPLNPKGFWAKLSGMSGTAPEWSDTDRAKFYARSQQFVAPWLK